MTNDKLNELVRRMNGDLMVAILGSTRSGKSTFVNKFMEKKILPHITDETLKHKLIDELPQTAVGKQIMTVEPKFIPSQQLEVDIDGIKTNIRLVDSVGYVLDEAEGYETEAGPRLVKTPWFDEEIPFKEAAEIGMEKIMQHHSHLGIVLTSDGSFGEFRRESYEENEEKIIAKMKDLQKPFVIVLNTTDIASENVVNLSNTLRQKYETAVIPLNLKEVTSSDFDIVIYEALKEFPISSLTIKMPSFLTELGNEIKVKQAIDNLINDVTLNFTKMKEVELIQDALLNSSFFSDVKTELFDVTEGKVLIEVSLEESLLTEIMKELCGYEIKSQAELLKALYDGYLAKALYEQYHEAIKTCEEYGYGVAIPSIKDMCLLSPTVIKQGGRYGVKVSAKAPSIHMLKVDVESSFAPIIGSLEQSKVLIESLEESGDEGIWQKEIFGRKLSEIVNDGIKQKIYALPDQSKLKLKDVLAKLINSSKTSLIAIIL